MKAIWKEIVMALIMGMLLPGIVADLGMKLQEKAPLQTVSVTQAMEQEATLEVLFRHSGDITQMDMDAYLLGVLLAEMPGDFETEAFKAQAVVARTYALKAYTTGGKHGDGSVCGEPGCCQAYLEEGEYYERGGSRDTVSRMTSAIRDTSGQVLTYEGALIEATYFSCSGGSTEDAVAVWGTDFPYLRATSSPGEEKADHFSDRITMPLEEFSQKLGLALSGGDWLGTATYTAGGGVAQIAIGDREFKGTELRSLLGLRSTNFRIMPKGEQVTIETRGFGHRVGMSQYGADAMAVGGSTYAQILAHYYQGTDLTHWEN